MSNFLAIATVTATLQYMLHQAVEAAVSGAEVTTLRPDGVAEAGATSPGVNIYLYQVTPNSAWRNADLPSRSSDGRMVQRPCVALDLHYLLTFYGADNYLEPQRLLGIVARTLHTQPKLTQGQIEGMIDQYPEGLLGDSDLACAVELVRFTPLALSLEELSKLWSVFFQTPYSLSVAYLASTVLIEAEQTPQPVLPVRTRNIAVAPFQQAVLEQAVSIQGDHAPIVFGDVLLLKGRGLGGDVASIHVGDVPLAPGSIANTEIHVTLTEPGLRAGAQGVYVVYANGAESNVAPLVLRPTIESAVLSGSSLSIRLRPAVGRRQRVVLYLNQLSATEGHTAHAYSFRAPPNNGIEDENVGAADVIAFTIGAIAAGQYLVRVLVAGAESATMTDDQGKYSGPLVAVS